MVKIKCDLYKSGDIQVFNLNSCFAPRLYQKKNPRISTQPNEQQNNAVEPFLMKKKQSFIFSKLLCDN